MLWNVPTLALNLKTIWNFGYYKWKIFNFCTLDELYKYSYKKITYLNKMIFFLNRVLITLCSICECVICVCVSAGTGICIWRPKDNFLEWFFFLSPLLRQHLFCFCFHWATLCASWLTTSRPLSGLWTSKVLLLLTVGALGLQRQATVLGLFLWI